MSNNPLSQYFRRPALFLKLPSGGEGYPEGAIDLPDNGELPVYPMTAIDEITSRTPDALYNGTAVVELIRSCIPNIKDPWSVLSIDLDPMLVAIRIATLGETMEINTTCPKCEEENKFDINLNILLAGLTPSNYGELLEVNGLKIKFRPLDYKNINDMGIKQFEIQKAATQLAKSSDEDTNVNATKFLQQLTEMSMHLLVDTIEYIKTPTDTVFDPDFILEFIISCDKNTHELIKTTSANLRKTSEIKPIDITCQHCQHEYNQSLNINVSNFFG